MSFKKVAKTIGVLAIIYHLLVVVLLPNRDSFLNQTLYPYFTPYANLISMNVAWQFFSPDPGPATYLLSSVHAGSSVLAEEYLPPEKDEFLFRQFFNRRIAAMRFLGKDPDRARRVLVPWLCLRYPEATSVRVQKIVVSVPSLDAVRAGAKLNDLSSQISEEFVSADCDRGELVE